MVNVWCQYAQKDAWHVRMTTWTIVSLANHQKYLLGRLVNAPINNIIMKRLDCVYLVTLKMVNFKKIAIIKTVVIVFGLQEKNAMTEIILIKMVVQTALLIKIINA